MSFEHWPAAWSRGTLHRHPKNASSSGPHADAIADSGFAGRAPISDPPSPACMF
eukprot:CAMPEP_0179472742 /NCGR_PEP_ID=MMETSP0799-20121207/52666_1 /TAXON_ID=46947 /ORGANISM="Geminigera cryophila, Strain CCMP2564" /LENGTH=53 /DNA_ID=CAMNT_0021281045 /DNA_START=14 /DNA_END=172 /DNA_ORIENTATION=-